MIFKNYLTLLLIYAISIVANAQKKTSDKNPNKKRPNILFCISDDQSYKHISLENVKDELFTYLKETNDPRMEGLSPWDNYPFYSEGFDERYLKPVGKRDGE